MSDQSPTCPLGHNDPVIIPHVQFGTDKPIEYHCLATNHWWTEEEPFVQRIRALEKENAELVREIEHEHGW